ncbi:Aste57867_17173 [Aphanomyces stellatus]|uniref:Spermatogenesis-associated protein 4 n=1 Tax=Aphanomyces stellatus TaxID=120398 RepID=A0A485L8U2_9STRA|nr:hypothetical protein As57867_017114 [Aphanomyces stellatus]VFT93930.1 Aste57867_17173 [Aphanomyces stellatus]
MATTNPGAAAAVPSSPLSGSLATSGAPNKLNRELLRWLQSLDLAYSLKNIKRDFSNGFLVAEILSRYYDKDISMHSFDNGIGLKVKKDNWDQLVKFMQKIPDFDALGGKAAADGVMHCENGAAVAYLGKLYQCLTKRELQTVQSRPVEEDIPPYAKPTGSTLIREKMRGPGFVETSDEFQLGQKARTVNARHEEALQLERLTDTDRFGPTSNEQKMVRPRKQKLVGEESPICTQTVVKEVQIKTIDDKNFNLAQLRAMREANNALLPNQTEFGYGVDLEFDGVAEKSSVKRRAMDLLNECIARKLTGTPVLSQLDGRKDRFEGFLDAISAGGIVHDQDAADVLESIVDPGGVLSNVLLDSPKDFWKITGLLHPCLADHGDDNPIFHAAVHLWVTMGMQCVKKDPNAAALLMADFALPRLAALLTSWPTKRHAILRIVYAFSSPKLVAHIQVIKRLREALPTMTIFVDCLALLLSLETDMDDTLADLYFYYCCIGLDLECEKLRAACLTMLPRFLRSHPTLALDLVPRIVSFSTRWAWWEVKAQLIVVSVAFLDTLTLHPSPPTDHIETCLTVLTREFTSFSSLNIRRLGLAHVGKLLGRFQELVPNYVEVLRGLPLPVLHEVVSATTPFVGCLPVLGASGATYHLPPVRGDWDSLAIGKQTFLDHREHDAESTEHEHAHHHQCMVILQVCFDQLAHDQPDNVNELYRWTQEMVLAMLDREHTCDEAASVLSTVMFYSSPSINVLDGPVVTDVLGRICSGSPKDYAHRHEVVAKFLHQLYVSNHAAAVKECLGRLKSTGRQFQETLLAATFQDMA